MKEAGDGDEEGFVQIDALYASDKEEAEEKVLSKLQELLHALLDRGIRLPTYLSWFAQGQMHVLYPDSFYSTETYLC